MAGKKVIGVCSAWSDGGSKSSYNVEKLYTCSTDMYSSGLFLAPFEIAV